MRTFRMDCSRKAGKNARGETYRHTTILNYRYTKEGGVELLNSMGDWVKSILRIDALLMLAGLEETTQHETRASLAVQEGSEAIQTNTP